MGSDWAFSLYVCTGGAELGTGITQSISGACQERNDFSVFKTLLRSSFDKSVVNVYLSFKIT
jgi:hypothetical protein